MNAPRAVVDDVGPKPRYRYQIGSSGYWVECDSKEATVVYPDGHEEPYRGISIGEASEPQPRALVALSEDGKWLVVRCREGTGYGLMFAVLMCRGGDYEVFDHIKDTGQDAHEVLREWMEGRG